MKTALVTLVIAFAAIAAPATADTPNVYATTPEHPMHYMNTQCRTVDSTNCYWNVRDHYGMAGHSFYAMRIGNLRCVKYWEARYNRRHGFCERR
jgi:hypothetical protein